MAFCKSFTNHCQGLATMALKVLPRTIPLGLSEEVLLFINSYPIYSLTFFISTKKITYSISIPAHFFSHMYVSGFKPHTLSFKSVAKLISNKHILHSIWQNITVDVMVITCHYHGHYLSIVSVKCAFWLGGTYCLTA